jgi:hypothetical protein
MTTHTHVFSPVEDVALGLQRNDFRSRLPQTRAVHIRKLPVFQNDVNKRKKST